MEFHWINRENNPCLVLFVLGWAADHKCVEHFVAHDCDVATIYDYREIIQLDSSIFEPYAKTYLFAWSFGVWVSEQLFKGMAFDNAVAFNGTPFPIDPNFGLDPRRAAITLNGVRSGGMEQFNRRAYGEYYQKMSGILNPRSDEDNFCELDNLIKLSSKPYTPSIEWSKAIIGQQDMIFPVQNMEKYWQQRSEILPLPHYPFGDPNISNDQKLLTHLLY